MSMARESRVICTAAEMDAALHAIAREIMQRATPEPLAVVGLLSKGDVIAARLSKILQARGVEVRWGAIDISLYRDDIFKVEVRPSLRSSDLPFSTDDMRLILVDDVLHTGRTIRAALNALFDYGRPARIELACLVDRGGREVPIEPTYVGVRLPEAAGSPKIEVSLMEAEGEDSITYRE